MQSISINDRKNSTGCIPSLDRPEWFSRSRSLKLTYGFLTISIYSLAARNYYFRFKRKPADSTNKRVNGQEEDKAQIV